MKKQLFLIIMATMTATTLAGCNYNNSIIEIPTTTESTIESMTTVETENTSVSEQSTTANESETEINSSIEESTTVATTTEESTTEESSTSKVEIETISPDKDPFTSEVAGSYTDEDYEYYVKIRTYENGAKRYVYHVDSLNKDYEFTNIEELPEDVALDMYEKLVSDGLIGGVVVTKPAEQPTTAPNISNKITIDDMLEMDKNAALTGEYKKNNVIYNSQSILSEIMPIKNNWIKNNYGTQFNFNGIKFLWDNEHQYYYYEKLYGDIHYMTGTTTSIKGHYIKNYYSYRLADYLGFYGTDHAMYMNEKALDDGIWQLNQGFHYEDKTTVGDPSKNNLAYLKQLGWTEEINDTDISKNWSLISPEGIPSHISSNGYISIYIKYTEDKTEKSYEFTIEEYNDFIKNTSWEVRTRSGSRGLEGTDPNTWQKYISKYLVLNN